jgi:trehalose 6-phosphate synthase/phosphatase
MEQHNREYGDTSKTIEADESGTGAAVQATGADSNVTTPAEQRHIIIVANRLPGHLQAENEQTLSVTSGNTNATWESTNSGTAAGAGLDTGADAGAGASTPDGDNGEGTADSDAIANLKRFGLKLIPSSGGLATALGSLHNREGSLWIGSADLPAAEASSKKAAAYNAALAELRCVPVYLTKDEQRGYYERYSNSVLWPLFHDFPQNARFDTQAWETYVQVNRKFCNTVLASTQPDDIIWIQDYQLMLLPQMLREARPNALIGFFLHIPFPDYETFRMLPQRRQILQGLLGADLIGFHTYDYVRHFLSSCGRILGYDNHMGSLMVDGRMVRADVFPLGIDYERFAKAGASKKTASIIGDVAGGLPQHREPMKNILSLGRLDYTKGVPELLNAYDTLLERYPEWQGRVRLWLVCVPSRSNVPSYARLKRSIDELVGRVNGKYARADWNPIRYFYRSLDFDTLCATYRSTDVMAITPLRDGMNLVAKEYLAAHDGGGGVLVLSEMAGAAVELTEAIQVNPFDRDALAEALHTALTMPEDQQRRRNALMQRRLSRYTATKWAEDFMDSLVEVRNDQQTLNARLIGTSLRQRIDEDYRQAQRRTLLLDYDGTLMPFSPDPTSTSPDEELLSLLKRLADDPRNQVAILSGRDKTTLEQWWGDLDIDLVAEHGAWLWDKTTRTWNMMAPLHDAWMPRIKPVLQGFVDRTPGSFLEEKDYSLVWHYRACSTEISERRLAEMRTALGQLTSDLGLQLAFGNKVVEVKLANVDKGSAAYRWLSDPDLEFSLVAGDDYTDEDMFRVAPESTWTVKVGVGPTLARCAVRDSTQMRGLLESLLD